jgi:polyhydroxybutyrate depolymerase
VDDIAFLKQIIADLGTKAPIDTHRIYVAGFSDGGRMAYRAACQMASQIAAVAVVSGSLVTQACAPTRTVFVIAFHGTLDGSVPYHDPAATAFPRAAPKEAASLSPSIQFWMAENSCTHSGDVLFTPDVVRTTATGCGAQVIFYTIAGGTHAWPVLGPDYEFSASPLIADFFAAHRLP